jgi:hypothetical protein
MVYSKKTNLKDLSLRGRIITDKQCDESEEISTSKKKKATDR